MTVSDVTDIRGSTGIPETEFAGSLAHGNTMILQVKVKPRSRDSSLAQSGDGTWVARVKAPPVDGKANAELITLVARHFRCRKSDIVIESGASGRLKRVSVKSA